MDQADVEAQYPILSYLLSQLEPDSHPPLPPQLAQTVLTRYPHLANPSLLSSLARSIPPTASHTLSLLRSLGPRPGPDAVSSARSRAAQVGESDRVAEMYRAVLRLEEMHAGCGRQLAEVEERLLGVYREALTELEGGAEVNEEVVAVLRGVESGVVVESLDLSGRQLRLVPEAFGKIKGLLLLNLSRNQIEFLPDSISGLEKLEQLDVSSNLLESLPDSIGLLRNLKILRASGNKFTQLPESIALCSSLLEIDASFNNLVCLPSNIGYGLANLERLSIQLNKICLLPPSTCEMKSLRYLDAHFNKIRGLPYAIGRLTSLEVLNLSSNFSDLTELPETIGDLLNLRELDLSNNQLRSLPVTFGRLEHLTKLNLDGNPLLVPPREIVAMGVEAVREFMIKMHLDGMAEEQQRLNLEANQESAQSGWLAWGTSLLSNVVSGISGRISGYVGGQKPPADPYLDQQL